MVDEVEKEEKKEESWVTSKWRPCMGWLYMATCAFDFILGPIFWAFLQTITKQTVTQWMPLTLQGAGLYHVAMGAVLGVSAWSRGQEKMAGASSQGTTAAGTYPPSPSTTPRYMAPAQPTYYPPSPSTPPRYMGQTQPTYYPQTPPQPRPVATAASVTASKVLVDTDDDDADQMIQRNPNPEGRS